MIQDGKLKSTWDFIDEIADKNTKEMFELDDMLYQISMKIFDYRIANGWTQKQLAQKLGIKQSMVSKLESGVYNPTVELLWKISKKLNWSFKVILEDKEEMTNIWDSAELNVDDINNTTNNDNSNKMYQDKLAVGS